MASIIHPGCVLTILLLCCLSCETGDCCSKPFCISESAYEAEPSSQSNLSVAEIIEKQGFRARTYQIESYSGGYLVAATRIINPKDDTNSSKQVVVIHHGSQADPVVALLIQGPYSEARQPGEFRSEENNRTDDDGDGDGDGDGDNKQDNDDDDDDEPKFIPTEQLRNNCLAYFLSNLGYDVWLLHARGATQESSSYVNESLEDPEKYWDFNLDDQSSDDLPSQIDFIRNETKQDKVAYIGFSWSTIFMFQLLSTRPEFADTRLVTYIAIGPEIYKKHVRGVQGNQTAEDEERLKSKNGPTNSLSDCADINKEQLRMCPNQTQLNSKCRPQYAKSVGPESVNVYNKVFLSNYRSPASSKSIGQMAQYVQKEVFNKFDYGCEGNLKHYGQEEAPIYNVSAIKFERIALVRSTGNDYLSDATDQEHLIGNLTVPLYKDIITPSGYDHYSYFLAYNSYKYVNRPIYEILRDTFEQVSTDTD